MIQTLFWKACPTTSLLQAHSCNIPLHVIVIITFSQDTDHFSGDLLKENVGVKDVLSEEEGEVKGKSNYGQIQGSGLMSYAVLLGLSYS